MNSLEMAQVSRRVEPLRELQDNLKVNEGWIRYMRLAMGLKLKDFGKLVGLAPQTVKEAEVRESVGAVTLKTLERMANAMECDLVYGFVPRQELSSLIKLKAHEKARKILQVADTHMGLEDQAVEIELEERINRLATKLIEKDEVW